LKHHIKKFKIGDLVRPLSCVDHEKAMSGIIIGFNKKGLGGKEFVHILAANGHIVVFNAFDLEVINEKKI
jgi:hypothetical protein